MRIGSWAIPETTTTMISFAKRLLSAMEIKPTQIRMVDAFHAKISGSSPIPYDVTLETCNCGDFSFGRSSIIPCKHIIRLALETGQVEGIPVFNRDACMHYDFDAEIAHLKDLWAAGILPPGSFHKAVSALNDAKKEAEKLQRAPEYHANIKSSVQSSMSTAKDNRSSSFVITGTPTTGETMDIIEAVIDRGYTCSSNYSKNTAFLLAFNNPSESKLLRAESLGIPIIHENELQECLKTGKPFI